MRILLKIAANLMLTGAAVMHAQITNPDNLVSPVPKPQRHLRPTAIDDLQWLWAFAKPAPIGRANDLRMDVRFQAMLAREFKQAQSMWGEQHMALANVVPLFVSKYGAVAAEQNRYLTVDGCVPSFCAASGLLWVDLGTTHPLAIFAGVNWSTQGHATDDKKAEYDLWLFSNRNIDPNALPLALTEAIAHWDARLAEAHRLVPHITHALLVEPDGSPYALDPILAGANTIAPQPDTTTPHTDEN